ncbi:MAG: molybdopterin oxidoreductase, partial [Burkholderiaceae bacterium]|nr:molybdopterin oxidoreductase [Burkholderiaceae bacterium]
MTSEKSNEPEKAVCPVTTCLEAFRIRLHSQEVKSPALRTALAEAARILTEISLGRATEGHLKELAAVAKSLPDSEHSLATSLRTSLDKARDQWLAHITDNVCNAGICFEPRRVPCQEACPAHIDIPSMIAQIGHGNYDASLSILLKDSPLPNSCGLVC